MRRGRAAILVLVAAAVAAASAGVSAAARPDAIELDSRTGALGRLSRIVGDDGAVYVAAERLAALLGGSWKVTGAQATLTVGPRSAVFRRDQPRVVVQGQALALDAPPRRGAGGWLIPEDFLAKGLARLAPGVTAALPAPREADAAARPAQAAVALEALRTRSYPSFTRVVVETGGRLAYAVATGREEIRVRLPGLAVAGARREEIGDGLVKEVVLETAGRDAVLRVRLEAPPEDLRDFTLSDPFRLVLDLYRRKEAMDGQPGPPGLQPLRLIVLDPGHGGHDPGARGPTGLQEKDVVLDVTRRVARLVEDELGVRVAMTRNTDVFIPLRERTNFANRQRADLFVSIHANAHPRAVSQGVETYFLSSEASDSDARQVAAIENGVIQLESPAARAKGDVLKTILWDLAQSEFQQESSVLAETVLDSMTRSLRLVNRGVKQAGFYVLGGAATPAILVEIGFLTNRKEERKLATPAYRAGVARAIYEGLAEYKRRHDQRLRTVQSLPARAEPAR
jgi:N-acetylmuramoyl-L-alanine amidase